MMRAKKCATHSPANRAALACRIAMPLLACAAGCWSTSRAPPTATTQTGRADFPAALVSDVEALIRHTAEYNALAQQVQTPEDYQRLAAELLALEERLARYVAAVSAAEARLDPRLRAEFNRQYFDSRARPLIEEKRAHQQRLESLARQLPAPAVPLQESPHRP